MSKKFSAKLRKISQGEDGFAEGQRFTHAYTNSKTEKTQETRRCYVACLFIVDYGVPSHHTLDFLRRALE